ncbi:TetR/AcrR family transcriptional regulator [Phormidium sp. CLA17]|uniref:TetR/AcrR family transcriptional regulator n=1 Tax=Leptolyngbya sp. Cla-17 TaxID=2803751 RepID=UPI001490AE38|nr:TetR/AcrR family transcriptional regulator [Leptolyngbya sp. Cla-17]MBM0741101.1 TetR/AcrR family transcriptional regulator [Leptolyngbya sp. Cla-17]
MPKIVDHDQYRRELLDQCFDLFAEKGYSTITMRQIASGLGVSTGTLYHYFPSKEAIFEQLVEEMIQQDMLQVSSEVAKAKTGSDRLKRGFEFVERKQDYFLKQLLIFTDYYQQIRRDSNQPNVLERVCERIQPKISEILGIKDPQVAEFVFTVVDGICVSQIYGCNAANFSTQLQLLLKMLTAYLEKHEPSFLETEML